MKDVLIENNLSLRKAINRLNELGTKTLVISNNQNKFCPGEDSCSRVENIFTDESITKSYGGGKAFEVIFSLNRTSLMYTEIFWEKDKGGYNNSSKVYQCKVVDGV